jgi:hypothetical protein
MRPIAAILARLLARRARAALLSLPPAVALALAQQLLDRGDASFRWDVQGYHRVPLKSLTGRAQRADDGRAVGSYPP